jgi:hypothetical protein
MARERLFTGGDKNRWQAALKGAHLQVCHWNLFISCHHERAAAREGSAFPTFSAAFKAAHSKSVCFLIAD